MTTEASMPVSEFRKLWSNSKELQAIQKELDQHRKPFSARIKQLRTENDKLKDVLLRYLDQIQAPGIKLATGQTGTDGKEEYIVVLKKDLAARSRKNQAESMKTMFRRHQIDPSSPLYQDALDALARPEKKVGIQIKTVNE